MESSKNVSNSNLDICPIGLSNLTKINSSVASMVQDYKKLTRLIGFTENNERTPIQSPVQSPVQSPTGSPAQSPSVVPRKREGKSSPSVPQMQKFKTLVKMLALLGKIEVNVGRAGLDASLDIMDEIQKLHCWMTNNISEQEKDDLKQYLDDPKAKHKKEFTILLNLIENKYTPQLIKYCAEAIYAETVVNKEAVQRPRSLSEKVNEMLVHVNKKKEKTGDGKTQERNILKAKLEKLSQFLSQSNFATAHTVSLDRLKDRMTTPSLFSKTVKDAFVKLNDTQLNEQRYSEFIKFENALQLAMEILKNPAFPKKDEDELCKIIAFLQNKLDSLLNQSTKLKTKLAEEIRLNDFSNEVISKVNFTQLSSRVCETGSRIEEEKMLKEMLGSGFNVIARSGANGAVYIISKKIEEVSNNNNTPSQNTNKDQEAKEDTNNNNTSTTQNSNMGKAELDRDNNDSLEVFNNNNNNNNNNRAEVSNNNNEPNESKAKPSSPTVVIRAQKMNAAKLKTMTSPKHLVQRTASALSSAEPGFTRQYALMPGTPSDTTDDEKEYRNYEVSEAVAGRDLKTTFEDLHRNIETASKDNPENREAAVKELQINFIKYAKQLIQFIIQLQERGICFPDLKPSNVLTSGAIRISDDKTIVNIRTLKENELFTPEKGQPLELTGGFYTTSSMITLVNGDKTFDMKQLSIETLAMTLYQLMSNENREGVGHRGEKNELQQYTLKMAGFLEKKAPIFEGTLGSEIKRIFQMLVGLMTFKTSNLNKILAEFETLELQISKENPVATKATTLKMN